MAEHPCTGSYRGSMYEHGIDAKIVIMGNTGKLPSGILPPTTSLSHVSTLSPSPLRCWEDQPVAKIYPEQVRPQEHDVHDRCIFRYEEGLQGRVKGQTTTLGHSGPRKVPKYGTSVHSNRLPAISLIIHPHLSSLPCNPPPLQHLMNHNRHPCIIAAQMPHCSCTILRMPRPLKASAVG